MSWIEDEAAAELARQHDERNRELLRDTVRKMMPPKQGERVIINGEPEPDQAQDQQPDPQPKMPSYSSEHGQPNQGLRTFVNQLRLNQRPDGSSRAVLK